MKIWLKFKIHIFKVKSCVHNFMSKNDILEFFQFVILKGLEVLFFIRYGHLDKLKRGDFRNFP